MTRSGRPGKGAGRGRQHKARPEGIRQAMTAARIQAGLTQAQLAELMCTHRTVVGKWENGQKHPTLTTLEKIAEVTGRRLEIRFVYKPKSGIRGTQ